MEVLERLGAELEDGWAAVDRDEERFPEVAARVLERHPPERWFRRDALLDALLDPRRSAIQQLAPLGAFGQPGFTVHHGDGFVIEVYYWLDSRSAIHNHPFCGVFEVLEGFSVHARYHVTVREQKGPRCRLVDASLAELSLVQPGEVHAFSLVEHPLVHALVHVPVPTISMVIRTTRTEGYFRVLPPTLAVAMEPPTEPIARRLALVESLGAARDPAHLPRLIAALDNADFETTVRLASAAWDVLPEAETQELIARARKRHGAAADAIAPALQHAARMHVATDVREQVRDPDHRLCATALAYAECREHVLGLLRARHDDPLACLHRFIDDTRMFEGDEAASGVIAHALVDGLGPARALEALEAQYGAEAVAPHEAAIREFCAGSIFAVLAR